MQKIILIIGSLITSLAFAGSTGEISISGSIIEEANCQITILNNKTKINCPSNQDTVVVNEIISYMHLEYIDKEKNLAVMYLTYN